QDVMFNGVRVGRGNGNQPNNTVVGNNSMPLNTTGDANTAFGAGALSKNNNGSGNTAIGFSAMPENTSGGYNTAIGSGAMYYNTAGSNNSAVGGWAMHFRTDGTFNTAFGHAALRDNQGNNNTSIGTESGLGNTSGSGNVFIGYQAGSGTNGSNTLYIANSGGTPLIFGDFSSERVGLGTTSPSYKLDVAGDINFSGEIRKNGTPITFDGSETKVQAGTGISVSGTGTVSDPYEVSASKPKFHLGQDTLGGIVFYIYLDANGDQRGLIVSKTETTGNWSAVTGYNGADRTYDGSYNMPFLTNSTAKDWVTANFSSDWFIPSIDELLILFNARMHVNKALHMGGNVQMSINNSYWSSFEYDSTTGMYLHFSNATTGTAAKATDMLVRAVRRF
ncbi:MAG: DUF1566 domain-containing protein, partial [Bacteroidetes bacterium]